MPTAREIRERINSVTDTLKITNAMYLISSTKLRKARKELEDAEPYFYELQRMMGRVLHHLPPEYHHRYLDEKPGSTEQTRRRGIICITADKGLAGAYNHNVLKMTEKLIDRSRGDVIMCIGEVGRNYFQVRGYDLDPELCFPALPPNHRRAREYTTIMMDKFNSDEFDELYIVFTQMRTSTEMEPIQRRLVPLDREYESLQEAIHHAEIQNVEYSLEPNADNVIENTIPNYVGGFVYSALVEAFCSEQNARMTAMDAANKNGEELKQDLSVQYNRVRQAQITQEITEVAAGEKAQRRNQRNKR